MDGVKCTRLLIEQRQARVPTPSKDTCARNGTIAVVEASSATIGQGAKKARRAFGHTDQATPLRSNQFNITGSTTRTTMRRALSLQPASYRRPPQQHDAMRRMLAARRQQPPQAHQQTRSIVMGCGSNVVDEFYPLRRFPKVRFR